MKPNGKRAFALLKKIGFERVSGTPEERKAAHILVDTIIEAGAQPVVEPFEVQDVVIKQASLTITAPRNKTYTVTGYKGAGNANLSGEIRYIGEVNEVSLDSVRGLVVLINGPLLPGMYEKIVKAGAAGVIAMSGTMLDKLDETDLPTRKLRTKLPEDERIPAVTIRMTDAFEIIKKGAALCHLVLDSEPVTLTSHNVSTTIPGSKHPDEIIVLGAHYDCVEFSQGVYDNGSGCVIIMELLHHFLKHQPDRTLRFVWFGSEEMGLLGSKAYLAAHEADIEHMKFMLNIDLGAVLLGREWIGVSADPDVASYLRMLAREVGFTVDIFSGMLSTDTNSFVEKGIPAVGFGRDGIKGSEFMHTRYDCIEFQSADVLANTANFVMTFIDRLCKAKVFPIPREIPEEIYKK